MSYYWEIVDSTAASIFGETTWSRIRSLETLARAAVYQEELYRIGPHKGSARNIERIVEIFSGLPIRISSLGDSPYVVNVVVTTAFGRISDDQEALVRELVTALMPAEAAIGNIVAVPSLPVVIALCIAAAITTAVTGYFVVGGIVGAVAGAMFGLSAAASICVGVGVVTQDRH